MVGPSNLKQCTRCRKLQKDVTLHVCVEQEYEVEAIENVGVDDEGDLMVLIKWKGFEESTWESFRNLNESSFHLLIDWFKINEIEQIQLN